MLLLIFHPCFLFCLNNILVFMLRFYHFRWSHRPFLQAMPLLLVVMFCLQGCKTISESLTTPAPLPTKDAPAPAKISYAALPKPIDTTKLAPPIKRLRRLPPPQKQDLLHKPERTITKYFGTPYLRRPEGPALIWYYKSTLCAMTIYFYEDGNLRQSNFIDMRPTDPRMTYVGDQKCLASLDTRPPVIY
jgi:hypothetical protein